MVCNLTLTLSSMDPLKQHCQALLLGQLLGYTVMYRSRLRLHHLFHLLWRTSPSHLPAHCLEVSADSVSGIQTVPHSHPWVEKGKNHVQRGSSVHGFAEVKSWLYGCTIQCCILHHKIELYFHVKKNVCDTRICFTTVKKVRKVIWRLKIVVLILGWLQLVNIAT